MDADPGPTTTYGDDRPLVGHILFAARATWILPAIIASVAGLLALGVVALLVAAIPSTTTYVARVQFTFPGIIDGRYPNGTPFTLVELIDRQVLTQVYQDLELDKFKLDLNEFANGFNIRPYASAELEITDRFRQQLSDRRLTNSERERIETQLKIALDQASRSAAEITLTTYRRFNLPDAVGRAIVQRIPIVWSQQMIEKRGVLRLPGVSTITTLVTHEFVESLSLPFRILTVEEAFLRVSRRMTVLARLSDEIMQSVSIGYVVNSVTGKTLRDIDRDVRDLELFIVNRARAALSQYDFQQDNDAIRLVVARRLSDVKLELDAASQQADAISNTAGRYVQSMTGLSGRSGETARQGAGDSDRPVIGFSTTPAVSDTQIDRIVQLQSKIRETEERYISDLTSQYLKASQYAILFKLERGRWQELLHVLEQGANNRQPLSDATRASIIENLQKAVDSLNQAWAAILRLENEFARGRLFHTSRLFNPFLAPHDILKSYPILNITTFILVGAIIFVVFFGIWSIRIASRVSRLYDRPDR